MGLPAKRNLPFSCRIRNYPGSALGPDALPATRSLDVPGGNRPFVTDAVSSNRPVEGGTQLIRPEGVRTIRRGFVIAQTITRCPTCGDLDIRLLGGGMMRCRTCGVIPVPARTLLPRGVLR